MTHPRDATDLMSRLFQKLVWLDDGLQARLHDRGWPDVSRAQSLVMLSVIGGIRRPADIARQVGVSRQAIHVTIGQMVALGIVMLEDDPVDARNKQVVLTAFGERMRADAQAAMADLLATLAGRVGGMRIDALLDALRQDWGSPR